jgi:hypothetical protein
VSLVLPEIFSPIGSPFPIQIIEILAQFSVFVNISFFRFSSDFSVISLNEGDFYVTIPFRSFGQFRGTSEIPLKQKDFFLFSLFSHRNVDESHFMWQQAVALIFLLVIEDMNVYRLGCLKIFAFENTEALFE